MGVTDLWHVLSPICERKPLWELQNKTVAIDLSCWVCDSKNIADYSQPRMYLRNLFFRTYCLLLLGVRPVFVLEGIAPALKHDTMAMRNNKLPSQSSQTTKQPINGKRSHFQGMLRHCKELLEIMGLVCVRSQGEAEALCAHLNEAGLVEGCVSQDGDCFLYGARTVYRNLTVSNSGTDGSTGFSVDIYSLDEAESKLSLGREKLIALALLCGCDYKQGGVAGVGRESVMRFLSTHKNAEVLPRIVKWRSDPYYEQLECMKKDLSEGKKCERCGHEGKKQKHEKSGCAKCPTAKTGCSIDPKFLPLSDPSVILELNMRRKALVDPTFPFTAVIDEFMQDSQVSRLSELDTSWKHPQLSAFIAFTKKYLKWSECYAVEKCLPLVTRWILINKKESSKCITQLEPEKIVKKRVLKGVQSYEIQWIDKGHILRDLTLDDGITLENLLTTVEPQYLVDIAFPDIVQSFIVEKEEKSKKAKTNKTKKKLKETSTMNMKENRQRSLYNFVSQTSVTALQIKNASSNCNAAQKTNNSDKYRRKPCKDKNSQSIESFFKRLSLEPHKVENNEKKFNTVGENPFKRIIPHSKENTPKRNVTSLVKSTTQKLSFEKEKIYSANINVENCDCVNSSDECEFCEDCDNEVLDLSAVIQGIVGSSCNENVQLTDTSSEDEFDLLGKERYVPLHERAKAHLSLTDKIFISASNDKY